MNGLGDATGALSVVPAAALGLGMLAEKRTAARAAVAEYMGVRADRPANLDQGGVA